MNAVKKEKVKKYPKISGENFRTIWILKGIRRMICH